MHRAVKAAVDKHGSRAAVAERLGITRQSMDQWEQTPPKHVLEMEKLSGVSRYDLRPDVYGPDPKEPKGRRRFNGSSQRTAEAR